MFFLEVIGPKMKTIYNREEIHNIFSIIYLQTSSAFSPRPTVKIII